MVTLKEAREISKAINKTFNPLSITIFGSTAKEGAGNDLDLLVVLDDRERPLDNVDLLMHRCLKSFYKKFAIDPFVISLSTLREHYLKGSPFLRLILKEGRLLYMKDAVKEWMRQSEDEFKMARYLLEGEFYKGACFHSQQAIEKALKAILLSKGWELEKTHSLERLVSLAEEYRVRIDFPDEDIVFMDSIYRGRYPAEAGLLPFGEPAKADARKAVNIAEQMTKKVKTKLNKKQGETSIA
ncbi:MAG: HEPN domain-containing protein [Nitrospirae bacterium]|nr:HEPN domain-containing protein [Nitrospirota bacterium]MCL5237953.1 HEPN domain-containing protein [Nitrospirota bacterium]